MQPDKTTRREQEKTNITNVEAPAKTQVSNQPPKPQTHLTDREDTLRTIEDKPGK